MPPYATAILGFLTGLIPSVVQIVVSRNNAKNERLKTASTSETEFRKQLLEERLAFVEELKQRAEEIRSLSERFSRVEEENHKLHLSLVEMQKQYAEMELKQMGYVLEIERLKGMTDNAKPIQATPNTDQTA